MIAQAAPLVTHRVYFARERLTLKQALVASVLIPALARVRLLRVWTGVCNGTPDHRPILGELAGVPGFFVASFPFLGFTAGPLLGRLVADLARGRSVEYDLEPFSPERFARAGEKRVRPAPPAL